MDEKEILDYLEANINCFKNIDSRAFDILRTLDSDELSVVDIETSLVTPLLKQISDYTLVTSILDEDDKQQLSILIDSDIIVKDSFYFCKQCFNYINLLLDNGCSHPTVVNTKNRLYICMAYDIFYKTLVELLKLTGGNLYDILSDFHNKIDASQIELLTELFDSNLDLIEENDIISYNQLLVFLVGYCKDYVSITGLFKDRKRIIIDNKVVGLIADFEFDDSILLNQLQDYFATSIGTISSYYNICNDDNVKEKLYEFIETYHLYNGYRLEYLRNEERENYLLQKCKKL